MSALFDRSVVCPICNVTFVSKKVKRSAIAVDRRDDDYCAYYKDVNPIFYSIFVCPSCGFSSFESEFKGVERLANRFKEEFKRKVASNWKGKDYKDERDIKQAIEAYKLALITYNALEYKKSILAKVFLRIAWLHRYEEDAKEMIFLGYARDYFVDAYKHENLAEDKENELITMLLVGELSRRLGDYKMAISWFDKLLKDPDVKKKRHIELKARDLWAETSQAYKKSEKVD